MKTIKSLTEAELAELPKLPVEWGWVKIGDHSFVTKLAGFEYTKHVKYQEKGDIPVIRAQNVSKEGFIPRNFVYVDKETMEKLPRSRIRGGEILMVFVGAGLGNVGIVPYNKEYFLGPNVAKIDLGKNLNNKYVLLFLSSILGFGNISGMSKATAQGSISMSNIREVAIPFVALEEQRAIVSKIELLFSELDNGIANLKLAQEQLKVYRQAVLKKAFEGELTRKWREQQTDLSDAGELLEKIRTEREDAAKATGKKMNEVKHLTEVELAELPRLPEGWRWAGLGEIINNIQAGKSIKCDERPPKPNELGIVKVSSVSWGEFKENESKTCFSEEAFNADYIIHENDFLFSRANTIELVGACVIVKSISKCLMLSDKILKIDFSQNHNNLYSLYYLRSVFGRKEIESLATGNQESMRNIGQDRIKQIKFPFCSLPEQQAIVQEIETRLSVCDKIEQDIETNLEKAEALRQSILKKAFEGKLLNERELAEVRGAEDWEPAEVLLERVRVEKADSGKKGRS
ncbi:restriction endonuclease subunit S [Methanosarcina sp. 1.H.A.2.2]|uniref:restriction endonuclease subunit S n=1 Tax=Methanosarcina sp. 1.H.A.2.2 TaxID=1483601 RepID=UPI00062179E5|nr:restriction endonuclease subunit S [Methanosarcina sp. 1.H.A.2.2]KKH46606.1 hypothetical protein EO93_10510 [Methanosarcina sp. 1.H.A.2.2]